MAAPMESPQPSQTKVAEPATEPAFSSKVLGCAAVASADKFQICMPLTARFKASAVKKISRVSVRAAAE